MQRAFHDARDLSSCGNDLSKRLVRKMKLVGGPLGSGIEPHVEGSPRASEPSSFRRVWKSRKQPQVRRGDVGKANAIREARRGGESKRSAPTAKFASETPLLPYECHLRTALVLFVVARTLPRLSTPLSCLWCAKNLLLSSRATRKTCEGSTRRPAASAPESDSTAAPLELRDSIHFLQTTRSSL